MLSVFVSPDWYAAGVHSVSTTVTFDNGALPRFVTVKVYVTGSPT